MQAHLTVILLGVIIVFISLLLVLLHSEFTWPTTQVNYDSVDISSTYIYSHLTHHIK